MYSEHTAAQHRQVLLSEAATEQALHHAHMGEQGKFGKHFFWQQALNLPIPLYDAQHANISQALSYDALRRRTKSIVWTVTCAAFGLGSLVGGLLGNKLDLLPVVIVGGVAALVAIVPVLARSVMLLKMSRSRSVIR